MAQKDKILDDIARVAGGTAGVLGGINRNIKSDLKSRIEEIAANLDLVPREDFERLEAQVKAQEERLKALETK